MMYPYMTLNDGTEITHSQLLDLQHDGTITVEVHFERPTDTGFDSARCSLPSYTWLYHEGFSAEEIERFEQFLKRNVHLFFKFAGQGGIFCAYRLLEKRKELKVLMIEKGRPIEKRVCPKRKTGVCAGCHPCAITTGFAGAGAFSDGKLSLSPDVGGNLPQILGYERTKELIGESDDIYRAFPCVSTPW